MKKNQPHQDIINKITSVLLIGYGWVGQFLGTYFKEAYWTDEQEKIYRVKDNSPVEKNDPDYHRKYQFAFINVPTPMLSSGRCDTSIVEKAVKNWHHRVRYFCIKSTIELGATNQLIKKYKIKACFSPEYVGETIGHPLTEPKQDTFVILGGEKEVTQKFAELWTLVTNSYSRIYQTSSRAAELCKLMENSWIGTKVIFCNEFFDLAEAEGIDFNELRELWLADFRVSRSHTYVYRNNRGFSGKCLPKDLNNLVYYYRKINKKSFPHLIDFILKYNAKVRQKYHDTVPLLPHKSKRKK